MKKLLKIFSTGLVISFLGSLPFGVLNITAFQIAAAQNIQEAIVFAIGVVLVELAAVGIALLGINKIHLKNKLIAYALPIGVVVLLYLAYTNFAASQTHLVIGTQQNIFPLIQSSFLLGIVLSALNPMHIPFWITWNGILSSRKTLESGLRMYSSYIIAIALGSFGALLIYILAGKSIFNFYNMHSNMFAMLIGCVYMGLAIYLSILFYKNQLRLKIN